MGRFADRKLTIRAADGFTPVVAFRMHENDPLSVTSSAMVHVHGGQLTWLDTHFYLELSPTTDARASWSLFRLQSANAIEFSRCSFTIRNVDEEGVASARRVAFIDMVPANDVSGLLRDVESMDGDTPTILLKNCIARGQATFARSDQAVPFWLVWEHGLFVSTQRMVEVGGTVFQPRGHWAT